MILLYIYNERTGEATRYTYTDENGVATHIQVFMVISMDPSSSLKFSLGYFGNKNATTNIYIRYSGRLLVTYKQSANWRYFKIS